MKIFLDDVREAPKGWILVRSATEAKMLVARSYIEKSTIKAISLDHDLGTKQTGYDVACFIEELVAEYEDFVCPPIRTHSANPVGRQRIQQVVESIRRITEQRKRNGTI